MEIVDVINRILRISIINILTYVVYLRLINYRENNYKKTIMVAFSSIINGIIGIFVAEKLVILPAILICYSLQSLVISKITDNKIQYSIVITFIALTITYLTYTISVVMAGFIITITRLNIQKNNTLALVLIITIQILILRKMLKIKRFKRGIAFLQDKDKTVNVGIIGFSLIGITMLIYSITGNKEVATYLFTGIVIEAICLTIWIRRKITKYYKQKMKEKTIEELENEIKEKDREISKILEENKEIATINHKYSSRIKSIEKVTTKILSKPELIEKMKVEFGTDFGDIHKQIKKLSEEYTSEIKEKINHKNELAKTGIFGIDNILEYMKEEAEKSNIKFDLKINGNINYMIENIINQSKLETLLGDHIKDAIIAIDNSNNTYKSILIIIGIVEECYEICIYDTGIEFEIETLLKLGTEAITTHKETGGSGIGFMTTFETLRDTKGSLIIEEKHPMTNTDYTKAIRIRFDGKNEYKICSYRANEIKKCKKDNRIIVEKLKR